MLVPHRIAGRLGLFHFAILLPDRAALGRFVRHLAETNAKREPAITWSVRRSISRIRTTSASRSTRIVRGPSGGASVAS